MAELIPVSIRVYIKYSFPLIVFRILPNIFGNTDGSLLGGRRLEDQGFAPETITDNRTRKNNRLFFNSQLLTDNHVTDFLGSGI